ncbi:uncharacterized protein BDW47DRAFT_12269 [Aspergillus candidus]|uniref:Uncharacterized protein n=1 Tax=Aspergillus candidus TaxID=41067 RepID=A0A2I2EXI9_ASPCN|nr:hypothetical protein BDW47DRAFT_12269 [Aspergillus candidus]PLB33098.1 hypothetical protein BDW47DRAFT_12269 [Aspergillus candidus]
MKSSSTKLPNGHGSLYKEVRFSPTATPIPIRRALSVPNTHSVLKSDASPRSLQRYSPLAVDYLEESRSLLVRQRTLFDDERRLWERERAILNARVAELESQLKNQETPSSFPPLSTNPSTQNRTPSSNTSQVWEGTSPSSPPTRVFGHPEKSDRAGPSIAEQGGNLTVSLDAALSPKSHPSDPAAGGSVPVPIEKLDSKLDGITLKSSALHPEIVARVMTPPSPRSPETSPSMTSQKSERRNSLKLRLSELGPPDKNLTRDAGHTPMVVMDSDAETKSPHVADEGASEGADEGDDPSPLAPDALRQPAENSDSYFASLPDDPALTGPLSLLNDEEHDTGFLKELDQKLLDQAWQALGSSRDSSDRKERAEPPSQEPELRFKNATNFGTAFGHKF